MGNLPSKNHLLLHLLLLFLAVCCSPDSPHWMNANGIVPSQKLDSLDSMYQTALDCFNGYKGRSDPPDASQSSSTAGKYITIRLRDEAGEETLFEIKSSSSMRNMYKVYSKRKGVKPENLKFLLDGEWVDPMNTPLELEMKDQDKLDIIVDPARS